MNALEFGAAVPQNRENQKDKNDVLLKIVSLSLLKNSMILARYENIKESAEKAFQNYFDKMFHYFYKCWLENRVTYSFCSFGNFNQMACYEKEYHNDVYALMNVVKNGRPNIFDLLGKYFYAISH